MAKALTDKQQLFLDVLFNEAKGNMRTAMNLAGYSPETAIREIATALGEEIIELAKIELAINSVKAARVYSDALSDETNAPMPSMTKMEAAKQVLDRVGVVKKEEINVAGDGKGAIFILPPKNETQ